MLGYRLPVVLPQLQLLVNRFVARPVYSDGINGEEPSVQQLQVLRQSNSGGNVSTSRRTRFIHLLQTLQCCYR
jgi:hypothetical protein